MDTNTEMQLRDRLLAVALGQMLDRGYVDTSINDICRAAGVTKGAFFHYFANKEALGEAVLDTYWQPLWALFEDNAPYLQLDDPLARVRGHCLLVADLHERPDVAPACLFGIFAQELATTNPALSALAGEAFDWWAGILKTDLDEAVQRYRPARPIDTAALAEHFLAVYEGALILARAQGSREPVRRNLLQYASTVEVLFGRSA